MPGARWRVFVVRIRAVVLALLLASTLVAYGGSGPQPAVGGQSRPTLTAFLDGVAIPLADVSRYYCDDFSYPTITCSQSPLASATRSTFMTLAAAVEYVTIYDQPSYAGSWMNVSQDYAALSLIGWNDRISSFRAKNSETGRFTTDWLYGGSQWSFCCNSQLPSLGGYDNTFSSVQRT